MTDTFTSSRIDDLPSIWDGMCKLVRSGLGLSAFGVNVLDIGPDYTTTDHTEAASGQEELYLVLSGKLQFKLGDEIVELGKHEAIRVPPGTWRGVWNDEPEDAELIIVSKRIEDPSADAETLEDFWPE